MTRTPKTPPPDHLIPTSWLEKSGVSAEEIADWLKLGKLVNVDVHGGASFVYFQGQNRPIKYREIKELIEKTRSK